MPITYQPRSVGARDGGAAATELVAGGGRRGRALAVTRYGGGGRLEETGKIGNQFNLNLKFHRVQAYKDLLGLLILTNFLNLFSKPQTLSQLILSPRFLKISHFQLVVRRRRPWEPSGGGYSGGPT
jgi:hypothetical protein